MNKTKTIGKIDKKTIQTEYGKLSGPLNIIQFTDAMVGVFENSDAVAEGFAYARYFHQTGIDPEWETNPLVKLGEKLMQEHAMLDFHKIVLDTDYRKSLWKRP